MHKVCECGWLKTKTKSSSIKRMVLRLKGVFKPVTCLSLLGYKQNSKGKWCYDVVMKAVFLLMPLSNQMKKRYVIMVGIEWEEGMSLWWGIECE